MYSLIGIKMQLVCYFHLSTRVSTVGKKKLSKLILFFSNFIARSYFVKRGTVYKITKVDTRKEPWIFQLTDVMGKTIAGYYYAAELMHVPDMKVLKYLKFKRSRTGKKLGLARFKGYPR